MSQFICAHANDALIINAKFVLCQDCARLYPNNHPVYGELLHRHSIWEVRQSLMEGHRELQRRLGTTDMEILGAYAAQGADLPA